MKKDENIIYFVCTHTLTSGPDEVSAYRKNDYILSIERKSGCFWVWSVKTVLPLYSHTS